MKKILVSSPSPNSNIDDIKIKLSDNISSLYYDKIKIFFHGSDSKV